MELFVMADTGKAVYAAAEAGADCIIFPASHFSTKTGGHGLGGDEYSALIKSCHQKGVLAYALMDCAAPDEQLFVIRETFDRLNTSGADGVMLGDLGLLRIVRAVAPEMPAFAADRLCVHSLADMMGAYKVGFSGAMLAPELSKDEIKFITEKTLIPAIVKVQGFLCPAFGGKCRIGRSDPDCYGKCSMLCRESWAFFGEGYESHLAMKEYSLLRSVQSVLELGAEAALIDARGRSAEYAEMLTRAWRRAFDDGRAAPDDLRQCESLFAPGGTTDGYFTGSRDSSMFGLSGEASSREIRKAVSRQKRPPRTVKADMLFSCVPGRPAELTVTCGACSYTASQQFEGSGGMLTAEEIARVLADTDEPYAPGEIEVRPGSECSKSAVVSLRRQALAEIALRSRVPQNRAVGDWKPGVRRLPFVGKPKYIYSFSSLEQFSPKVLEFGPAMIQLPLQQAAENMRVLEKIVPPEVTLAVALDHVVYDSEWSEVIDRLKTLKTAGVRTVVCQDLGQAAMVNELGLNVRGGMDMGVHNSQSARQARALGLQSVCAAWELDMLHIRLLSQTMPCEVAVYGRIPEMVLAACVIKNRTGTCTCDSGSSLVDKKGKSYPLVRSGGCRNVLYSPEKLYLADKKLKIESMGVEWLTLHFTTENMNECVKICRDYHDGVEECPARTDRGFLGKIQ